MPIKAPDIDFSLYCNGDTGATHDDNKNPDIWRVCQSVGILSINLYLHLFNPCYGGSRRIHMKQRLQRATVRVHDVVCD